MSKRHIAGRSAAAICLTMLLSNYAFGVVPTVRSVSVSTMEREVTDHLVKLPGNIVRDDLVLCIVSNDGAVQTDWAGTGFIEIADADHSQVSMSIAYKRAASSDTGLVRIKTTAAERSVHKCYAISGWDGESKPEIVTSNGRSTAPIFSPFVAGERSDYLFIATAAMDGQRRVTGSPIKYQNASFVSSRNSGGDVALAWAHRSASQTSRELPSAGFRFTAADNWIARTIAVAAFRDTSTTSPTESIESTGSTEQQTTSTPSSAIDATGTATSALGASANVRSTTQSTDEDDDKLQTIAFPPSIAAGDLVLCLVATDGQVSHDWGGSEFTELFDDNNVQVSMSVGYKQASGNEDRTFVIATSGAERSAHRCYAIAGWDGTTRPELTSRTGSGLAPSFNTIAPRAAPSDYIYFAVAAMDGQRTVTGSPTSFSDAGFASSRNSGGDAAIAWSHKLETNSEKLLPSAGFTFSAGDQWITQAIAVKLDQLVFAQTDKTSNGSTGAISPEGSSSSNSSVAGGGGGLSGSTSQSVNVKVLGEFRLAWRPPTKNTDGSNINGLSEFRIYRGDRSKQYVEVVEVNGNASSFTMRAEVGTHYIAVSAVDLDGDESALSNEIAIVSR